MTKKEDKDKKVSEILMRVLFFLPFIVVIIIAVSEIHGILVVQQNICREAGFDYTNGKEYVKNVEYINCCYESLGEDDCSYYLKKIEEKYELVPYVKMVK